METCKKCEGRIDWAGSVEGGPAPDLCRDCHEKATLDNQFVATVKRCRSLSLPESVELVKAVHSLANQRSILRDSNDSYAVEIVDFIDRVIAAIAPPKKD